MTIFCPNFIEYEHRRAPIVLQDKSNQSLIYFLYLDEVLQYIGRTRNLKNRLYQHSNDGKRFDACYTVKVDEEHIKEVERLFITYFKPPLNSLLAVGYLNRDNNAFLQPSQNIRLENYDISHLAEAQKKLSTLRYCKVCNNSAYPSQPHATIYCRVCNNGNRF